jgi:hypothetical protein
MRRDEISGNGWWRSAFNAAGCQLGTTRAWAPGGLRARSGKDHTPASIFSIRCGNCATHKFPRWALTCRDKDSGQMGQTQTPPAAWSRRRTRCDPPALQEAIAAAQGLTGHLEGQIEIAAQLMGLPEDEVRPEVLKAAARANPVGAGVAHPRSRRPQVVVIERRGSRVPRR